ncbi:MAG: pyridoxamine 5'-phosphate oxidase family protein [Candidatus Scalindua sp.]|nr:pyridoxamine 5'-phosphate oxidase family protein [Candidatus Scalindua sp.]
MKPELLNAAVKLAEKLEHVFVATADSSGTPHVAAAGELKQMSKDHVTVSSWFCPGTLANLENNRRVSMVVWDAESDKGYQLLGRVEKVEDIAILNGYLPEIDETQVVPQVEEKLLVRVEKIIAFSHSPHSDLEE